MAVSSESQCSTVGFDTLSDILRDAKSIETAKANDKIGLQSTKTFLPYLFSLKVGEKEQSDSVYRRDRIAEANLDMRVDADNRSMNRSVLPLGLEGIKTFVAIHHFGQIMIENESNLPSESESDE